MKKWKEKRHRMSCERNTEKILIDQAKGKKVLEDKYAVEELFCSTCNMS
jgi:hypothetical protein